MLTPSLILALLWFAAAAVDARCTPREGYGLAACALVALGVPILGLLTYQNGPWIGLAGLFAGCYLLGWPPLGERAWLDKGGETSGAASGAAE